MPIQWSPARNADGSLQILQGERGDEEVIAYREDDVTLLLKNDSFGAGTLYVTSKRVAWLAEPGAASGASAEAKDISIDYPSIVLHALSRDPNSGHPPCIYCQLKSDAEEEDEDYVIPEMRLVSASPEKLDTIFKVMSEMAALNPDPDADDGEDDDDDDFIIDADGLRGGVPPGWEFVEEAQDGAPGDDGENGDTKDATMTH
ncbi:Nucleotide-sensitive chloride conductance regulator (ICln) protein [Besnoitia besnoiti]|uniref:Nucleotide-sensitive chloride conductance regulator (ICln) protein n=1 Tax=Besnoitia besnoiti TaxID=94643 RepID=A0A2A9MF97_BESBE|nr:Nucleotide-sensitive chloride conductance regulator (ICln) protein [Besnoitia besnoiti]PFH36589.1 Nucleotide-sensitive chloride conductance regulator (ICln) protein [Besnoitia besnoiti]